MHEHGPFGVRPHAEALEANAMMYSASSYLPRPGDVLASKYRIDGVLGVGGMATVLAATHLALRERVAIKVLLPELADDPSIVERFMQEGRAAARIRSEHVVRVLDVDVAAGRPYLVLEFLDGMDLDRLIGSEGPLAVSRAVDFVLQACEAVAEAHAAGIVHRDLKPANLFLSYRADGSPCVKVLDFGISKVSPRGPRESGLHAKGTLPSTVMGSPHYMSPEQMASARDVDARSDIWSLGAILHELLAGAPPFEGETITALCAQILREPPPPLTRLRPDAPSALEGVIFRCLEKEASHRYGNVAELAYALSAFGSADAVASAVRIGRVLHGRTDGAWSSTDNGSTPLPVPPVRRRVISAAEALEGPPPIPMHRPGWTSALLVAVVLGAASFVGSRVVIQRRDVRDAERAAAAAATAPLPAPSSARISPPVVTTTVAALALPMAGLASTPASAMDGGAAVPSPRAAPSPPATRAPARRVHAGGGPIDENPYAEGSAPRPPVANERFDE